MISRKAIDDHKIVINPGEVLDNNNAHEMAEAIAAAQDEGFQYLIVNMSDLEFLSSAGVGSILGAVEVSRESGGDVILCNVSEKIHHILDVLDLSEYLTIQANEEKACAHCAAQG